MNGPVRTSIASTVIVALVAVITALLTIAGGAAYQSYRTNEWRALQARHAALADQLAISLASPLWNFDRPTLAKIAESAFANTFLSGLSVRSADDGSIVQARARDSNWRSVTAAQLPPPEHDAMVQTRTITFEGELIGSVEVRATPHFVERSLQTALVALFIGVVGLDLLLVLGLYVLLYRIVLRPLSRMKVYAQAVSSGEASPPPRPADLQGEMASLQDSLVRMVERQRDAYEQLSQLHRRLESAKDEERRMLSHELHDELGQTLTALKLRMHMIARGNDAAARAPIDELVAMVDGLIARVRKISIDLRPPLLDELGLESALQAFVNSQGALSDTQLTLDARGLSQRFGPEVEMACFRIVQEGITNVLRHARADHAEVQVSHESGCLRIAISDDGAGVSAEQTAARARAGHLGIVGMRERARALGGEFTLSSPPEPGEARGTRIEVVLPTAAG